MAPARNDWGQIFFSPSSVDAVLDDQGHYVSGGIIQDCLIEWGGAGDGVDGAVEINGASPFIDHNTVRNNGTTGIHAAGRSANKPVTVSRNTVAGNIDDLESDVFDGGGIYVSAGYVYSNTVEGNSPYSVTDGGGIHASASLVISNSVFANQGAVVDIRFGAGIYSAGSTLIGNTVSGNGGVYGSGIYASGGTVRNNTVSGNTASFYGGGIYAIGSTVVSNTITGNSGAFFGGGIYADGGSVSGNTVESNSVSGGSTTRGGGVYADRSTINDNVIVGNSATLGGGVYAIGANLFGNTFNGNQATNDGGGLYAETTFEADATVTGNDFLGNNAARGGGIYGADAILSGNTLRDNQANLGGGIYASQGSVRGNNVMSNTAQSEGGGIYGEAGDVRHNTVAHNRVPVWGSGSGVFLTGASSFAENDVVSNTTSGGTSGATAGGIAIDGQSQIQYNDIYGNQPYDAEVVSSSDITATLNYWGSSACSDIPAQIYDGDDLPTRGKLHFAPSLYAPMPLAQLVPPTDLALINAAASITLNWMAVPPIPDVGCRVPGSSAPDVTYRVYYDSGDACPPFDGAGLDQGDSPIEVGPEASLTLSGLSAGDYAFAVTAVDFLGRESSYSDLVLKESALPKIFLPVIMRRV
jgi:predicted outer membrane repeat protein